MEQADVTTIECSVAFDRQMLAAELRNVIRWSYEDPDKLIKTELDRTETIYTFRDASRKLLSFFLVGWGTGQPDDYPFQVAYMGLIAASPRESARGTIIELLQRFLKDARDRQTADGRDVVLWYHTANPSVAQMLWLLVPGFQPSAEGTFDDWSAGSALAIQDSLGLDRFRSNEFPFLLRGASQARYSRDEREKISFARRSRGGPEVFSRFSLSEADGDRLFFVGRLPKSTANTR